MGLKLPGAQARAGSSPAARTSFPPETQDGQPRGTGRSWINHGAAEGTRTPDPIITNDVLYQLSYSGAVASVAARMGVRSLRQALSIGPGESVALN